MTGRSLSIGVLLLMVSVLGAAVPARADVRVDYTCKVESFNSFLQLPPGTVLSGYLVFSETAIDLNPDPTAGSYSRNILDAQATSGVLGSFHAATSTSIGNNTFIGNDFVPGSSTGRDQINIRALMTSSSPVAGWSLTELLLTMTDSTKTVFQDDSLANKTSFSLGQFDGKIDSSPGFNRVQYSFTNGSGSTGFQCALTSAATASAPEANAGLDQTVAEGSAVTLDGSGSTGTGLGYQWIQVAGPDVNLIGDTTTSPTFDAPILPGGQGAQTLTFELTVSNGGGHDSDSVNVQVTNVNHAPEAHGDGPGAVAEGGHVTLAGGASFDPDGDTITYSWVQTEGPAVTLTGANTAAPSFDAPLVAGGVGLGETLRFRLTVSDGDLTGVDDVTVTVEQDNHAPEARATANPTTVNSLETVTLYGNASGDPDGDAISYLWTQTGGPEVILTSTDTSIASFQAPGVSGPTLLTFSLTVSDGELRNESDAVKVTVVRPNDPPVCTAAAASPGSLWPPNHSLQPIAITGVGDPDNDDITLAITGVTQDEPVNGLGDGDTSPDAVVDGSRVMVRAERAGNGNGRVYTVHFTATDAAGASCSGAVRVTVPHSQKRGSTAIDDGQAYDSRQP